MKNKYLIIAAAVAALMIFIPVASYIYYFGVKIFPNHEGWAQFGDFFGGVLNPLYALLAFLAVLYAISLQSEELSQTREEFRKTADAAQRQISHLEESSKKEDIFRIIKSIDEELEEILEIEVSSENSVPRLQLKHVAHEAFRLRNNPNKAASGAYFQFLALAKASGSLIESDYDRMKLTIGELYRYLLLYETTSKSPVDVISGYFSRKYYKIIQVLDDLGDLKKEMKEYFEKHMTA